MLGAGSAQADVVTLTDGTQLAGSVDGNRQDIHIRLGDSVQSIPINRVSSIRFSPVENDPAPSAAPALSAIPVTSHGFTLPPGTKIAIRTIDPIASKGADTSREYAASLDEPLLVNGVPVVAAKASAVLRITEAKQPGKKNPFGHASLSIHLVSLVANGKRVSVETASLASESGSKTTQTAKGAGIGAAGGCGVGVAVAGGGGCAVGAGVGAGTGAVVSMMKDKEVKIPPETLFTFELTQPVTVD